MRQKDVLTGSQRAFLFRREAFLAGIRDRAESLWENGYRVQRDTEGMLVVWQEGSESVYQVDPFAPSCSCPFHREQTQVPLMEEGFVPCKHLLGLPLLLSKEIGYWQMRREVAERTASPNNGSSDRAEAYRAIIESLREITDALMHRQAQAA